MSKLRVFGAKVASTASTASTFSRYRVEALFSQSRGTVEALFLPMVRCISLVKTAFYGLVSRGCRGSFPNYSQEIEKEGFDEEHFPDSWEGGDEFDHEDFDEWWDAVESGDEELDPVEEVVSWTRRAVDEAIEDEKRGTMGDIPF